MILSVDVSPGNEQKLYVEKGNDALSYSPVPHCPGKSAVGNHVSSHLGRLRAVYF